VKWEYERDFGLNNSIRRAMQILQLVASWPGGPLSYFSNAMPTFFTGAFSGTNILADANTSKGFVFWDLSTATIIFVGQGMNGAQNIPAALSGWDAAGSGNGSEGIPAPYEIASNNYISQVPPPPAGGWQMVVGIGHSWGGAIVSAVVRRVNWNARVDNVRYLYTFGAPKVIATAASGWDSINIRRMIQTGDPVPQLPPGATMSYRPWVYLTNRDLHNWDKWRQISTPFVLAAGQPPTVGADGDYTTRLSFTLSLVDWCSGINGFGNSHDLASYFALTDALVQEYNGKVDAPIPNVIPTPVRETTRTIVRAREAEIQLQQVAVEVDPSIARREIINGIPIVPGVRFRGSRYAGHLAVFYGQEFLMFTRTRRQRKALVRQLNATL